MKDNDRVTQEMEMEKALVLAFVESYCAENNLSVEKLRTQRFSFVYDECFFAQPSKVKPIGLTNDLATLPYPTLIVRFKNGKLEIEETEYTKEYLKIEC